MIFIKEYDIIYNGSNEIFDKITEQNFFSVLNHKTNIHIIKHVASLYVKAHSLKLSQEIQNIILSRLKFVDYIMEMYNDL